MGRASNPRIPGATQAGLTVAITVFFQADSNRRAGRFRPPRANHRHPILQALVLAEAVGLEPTHQLPGPLFSRQLPLVPSRLTLPCRWWRTRASNPSAILLARQATTPSSPVPRNWCSRPGLEPTTPPLQGECSTI